VLNRPIYFGNINYGDQDGTMYAAETTAVATVERNVYGGDGRTIIIPAGSQLIGIAVAPEGTGLQEIQRRYSSWICNSSSFVCGHLFSFWMESNG
jgi:hypothetical protein